jgi:hypothetical protein
LVGILKKGTTDTFRMAMRLHLNTRFEDLEILFPADKANSILEIKEVSKETERD